MNERSPVGNNDKPWKFAGWGRAERLTGLGDPADGTRTPTCVADGSTSASPADCFDAVVKILKRREVYRHLSNAADRVASAAETLHAIVVKWT